MNPLKIRLHRMAEIEIEHWKKFRTLNDAQKQQLKITRTQQHMNKLDQTHYELIHAYLHNIVVHYCMHSNV